MGRLLSHPRSPLWDLLLDLIHEFLLEPVRKFCFSWCADAASHLKPYKSCFLFPISHKYKALVSLTIPTKPKVYSIQSKAAEGM